MAPGLIDSMLSYLGVVLFQRIRRCWMKYVTRVGFEVSEAHTKS